MDTEERFIKLKELYYQLECIENICYIYVPKRVSKRAIKEIEK